MAERKKAARSHKGPPSALETRKADREDTGAASKSQVYSVQVHTDERGLEVIEVSAESGDEAAKKALEKHNYKGTSVRGVTPASDPDPNSLGGERDAETMIRNAENPGAIINTLGTEANAEATEKLGKADIEELGE
jgi:hypothetical protein